MPANEETDRLLLSHAVEAFFEQRRGYRLVDLFVLRPSRDLGKLVIQYEPRLRRTFRSLMRSLGTRETSTSDFLSLLMFEPDYLREVCAIGRRMPNHDSMRLAVSSVVVSPLSRMSLADPRLDIPMGGYVKSRRENSNRPPHGHRRFGDHDDPVGDSVVLVRICVVLFLS